MKVAEGKPGRKASFTPEEDAILLATAGASPEETNERLRAAGFPARSAAALKNRRYYLSKSPNQDRTSSLDTYLRLAEKVMSQAQDDDQLTPLVIRRRLLDTKIEDLEDELAALRGEREAINREIHHLVQQEETTIRLPPSD